MRRRAKQLLPFVLLLAIIGWTGCAGTKPTIRWPFTTDRTDHVPGIVTPAERMDTLRELAKKASQAGPAQQETISDDLAALYQREEDPLIRAEIVHAIGGCRTESAASVLQLAIADSDPDIRMAACEALGRRQGPETIGILSTVLASDLDIDVRMAAARALGDTGNSAAMAPLGRSLEDRDPALQHQAVLSLRQCSDEDLGNDVNRWRQHLRGEAPDPPKSISIAQRIKEFF